MNETLKNAHNLLKQKQSEAMCIKEKKSNNKNEQKVQILLLRDTYIYYQIINYY